MKEELRKKLIELFEHSNELGKAIISMGVAIEKHEKTIVDLVEYLKLSNPSQE